LKTMEQAEPPEQVVDATGSVITRAPIAWGTRTAEKTKAATWEKRILKIV